MLHRRNFLTAAAALTPAALAADDCTTTSGGPVRPAALIGLAGLHAYPR